jgi:hypothetical protein
MIMAFEIEEVEVEEDPRITLHILSQATGVSVRALLEERARQRKAEEFWSDPCWIEPLDNLP